MILFANSKLTYSEINIETYIDSNANTNIDIDSNTDTYTKQSWWLQPYYPCDKAQKPHTGLW